MFEHDPRVVIFGGGTGLSSILKGLKRYPIDITAVVSVADDGGSSGRLREMFDMAPPGDIRRVIISLAKDEELFRELFNYRFPLLGEKTQLGGHAVGNILLAALSNMNEGNMAKAIEHLGKVMNITGRVLPISDKAVDLVADFEDGSSSRGETNITKVGKRIAKIYADDPYVKPNVDVIKAIEEADLIIYSAGSLYTSLIPNLIYSEVVEALKASKAYKIYVANVMTQKGETIGYTLSDHVRALLNYIPKECINMILANDDLNVSKDILDRYKLEQAELVEPDIENLQDLSVDIVLSRMIFVEGNLIRHDNKKKAAYIFRTLLDLME